MPSSTPLLRASALAVTLLAAGPSLAAPLLVYDGPAIDKTTVGACLSVGDLVTCSAGMLNVLNSKGATDKTTQGGYVLATPQGALKTAIVLGTGGNASTGNGDVNPLASRAEDGHKTNSGGDNYAATGMTGILGGNLGDPDNNALRADGDAKGTWDAELSWLRDSLTVNGMRREMMIGFDYNQPQNGTGSLNYWALVTVRDLDTGKEVNYEVAAPSSPNPFAYQGFTSSKTFNSKPNAADFSVVNTITCFKRDGLGNVIVGSITPIVVGNCPDASYEKVDNAKSDSTTEIFAFLPELNANLESFISQGYDTMSVRFLFGCFGGASNKNGQGYLADNGETTQCDGGGNADVYLLAGAPMGGLVPLPGALGLAGTGLLLLGAAARRRRA